MSYLDKETQRELLDAFGILLSTGRKCGLTPFLFTQRIAQIDKSTISLGVQVFLRQVLDIDQRRCMEYIRSEMLADKKDWHVSRKGRALCACTKGCNSYAHPGGNYECLPVQQAYGYSPTTSDCG